MKKLQPTYQFEKIYDIPYEFFKKENISAVLLDVDNTLILSDKTMPIPVKMWLKKVQDLGIKVCLLSNSWNNNVVEGIKKEFKIYGLAYASKPLLKGFKIALQIIDVPKEECCIIGDQLFTDVYGANRFKIRSILTKRLCKNESLITRIKRPIEKMVLKRSNK